MALKYRNEYDQEYNKMEEEGKGVIGEGVLFRE
jgi:hypothetical protein